MMKRLLFVIDDEPDIREILNYYFKNEGFDVLAFENPVVCFHSLKYVKPSLILIDWLMPGMNGIDFCRKLKQDKNYQDIPIIMITCKSEENEIVEALESGADDYMIKPFRLKELHGRINRLLKSNSRETSAVIHETTSIVKDDLKSKRLSADGHRITVGNLIIDNNSHEVIIENKKINLTYSEFKLLELLARSPGKVFSREQIIRNDGGDNFHITDRAVDVRVVGLRKKLGEMGKLIKTIRSVGYKLATE